MVSKFRDHAANERTFLAWVRTAVALAGFGILIEKLADSAAPTSATGAALLGLSAVLVVLASVRFLIIRLQIMRGGESGSRLAAVELLFGGMLAVLVGTVVVFLYHLT